MDPVPCALKTSFRMKEKIMTLMIKKKVPVA